MQRLMYLEYLLVFVPTLTDWIEIGHLPETPREMVTEVVLAGIVGLLVWTLNQLQKRSIQLAETDGLTRISNRLKFQTDLAREVFRAHRLGTELVMVYIDMDRFKSINDRYGHPAGDHVLREVAVNLQSFVRDQLDCCYRIGGDEFAILLPANEPGGVMGIERRMAELQHQAEQFLSPYGAGLSLGITQLEPTDTPESFFERADRLMYQEKNARRREFSRGDLGFPLNLEKEKGKWPAKNGRLPAAP